MNTRKPMQINEKLGNIMVNNNSVFLYSKFGDFKKKKYFYDST